MAGSLDAEIAEHSDDADLDREQQRLRDIGTYQPLGINALVDQFGNGPA
jgi:hypothetical protein